MPLDRLLGGDHDVGLGDQSWPYPRSRRGHELTRTKPLDLLHSYRNHPSTRSAPELRRPPPERKRRCRQPASRRGCELAVASLGLRKSLFEAHYVACAHAVSSAAGKHLRRNAIAGPIPRAPLVPRTAVPCQRCRNASSRTATTPRISSCAASETLRRLGPGHSEAWSNWMSASSPHQ